MYIHIGRIALRVETYHVAKKGQVVGVLLQDNIARTASTNLMGSLYAAKPLYTAIKC